MATRSAVAPRSSEIFSQNGMFMVLRGLHKHVLILQDLGLKDMILEAQYKGQQVRVCVRACVCLCIVWQCFFM